MLSVQKYNSRFGHICQMYTAAWCWGRALKIEPSVSLQTADSYGIEGILEVESGNDNEKACNVFWEAEARHVRRWVLFGTYISRNNNNNVHLQNNLRLNEITYNMDVSNKGETSLTSENNCALANLSLCYGKLPR